MNGSTDRAGRGWAPARAALAGNPSDGYGGAVLAVALPQLRAEASARGGVRMPVVEPPSELATGAIARFQRETGIASADACELRWRTAIPRGVGLGGSSAIVIAVLRALCELHEVALGPDQLAGLALAVEVEGLGIAAGLQDRVAQAHGGLTFMDFAGAGAVDDHGRYDALDPALLPPLLVCWRLDAASDSGPIHSDLRGRFAGGDRFVRDGLAAAAAAARDARHALLACDGDAFAAAVDATFDARRRMMALDPSLVEMVRLARGAGAAANYTGSGGAIVAACRDGDHRLEVAAALRAQERELLFVE
jgi:glucuronokinase